jgi:hypothetical protein
MKISCRIDRTTHSSKAICRLESTKNPDLYYEFTSYTKDAIDTITKLMEEDSVKQDN